MKVSPTWLLLFLFSPFPNMGSLPYKELNDIDEFSLGYVFRTDLVLDEHFNYTYDELNDMIKEHVNHGGAQEDLTYFELQYRRQHEDIYTVQVNFRCFNITYEGSLFFNIQTYRYFNDTLPEEEGIYAPIMIPDLSGDVPIVTVPNETDYFHTVYVNSESFSEPKTENVVVFPDEDIIKFRPNNRSKPFLSYFTLPFKSFDENGYRNGGTMWYSSIYNIKLCGGSVKGSLELFLRTAQCNLPITFDGVFTLSLIRTTLDITSSLESEPDSSHSEETSDSYLIPLLVFLGLIIIPGGMAFSYNILQKKRIPNHFKKKFSKKHNKVKYRRTMKRKSHRL